MSKKNRHKDPKAIARKSKRHIERRRNKQNGIVPEKQYRIHKVKSDW